MPSEQMCSALHGAALEIIPRVESPVVISRVELRCLSLENLEAEAFHIPYQDYRPQLGILLCRLFNASVPDLQNLIAGFLNICEEVIVAKRKTRRIAA